MPDGPRPGATETFDCARTECSESHLPEPGAPAPEHAGLSRRGRTALALTGVALALVLMAASTGCGTNAPTAADTQLATPSQSPAATPETVPTPSWDKIESYAPTMAKYKDMDVDTFEALPRDERLQYSQYVLDTTVANKAYLRYENPNYNEYMITPVVASPGNTGQEIINDNLYALQLAWLQVIPNSGSGQEGGTPDKFNLPDGLKVLSSVYYDVGEASSTNVETGVYLGNVSLEEAFTSQNIVSETDTVKDTSALMTGTSQGETVQYKDVSFQDTKGKMHYDRYVYTEFTNYDGSQKSVWLLDAQAGSAADLASFGTVK
jgi:hypothetical protein